tara:strand:+ start:1185 stop:1484 length:300 start_codon:yes stop_codon:yes gene_type:complete
MRLKDCCFIVEEEEEEDVGVVDGDGETRSSRSGEVYLCSSVVFEFVIRALIFDDKGERVLSIPVTFDNKGSDIVILVVVFEGLDCDKNWNTNARTPRTN